MIFAVTSIYAQTWSLVRQTTFPGNNDFEDVEFVSATDGWAVGRDGLVAKTTNGGQSWTEQAIGRSQGLNDVFFSDQNNGWIAGNNGTLIATTDGGSNWTQQTLPTGVTSHIYEVHFINASTGWAVGGGSKIIATTNGGATWVEQVHGITDPYTNAVAFVDANNGWVVGSQNTTLKTEDGGANWTVPGDGSTNVTGIYQAHDVEIFSSTGICIAGNDGIAVSNDSGATWAKPITSGDFYSVSFANANNGIAVGKSVTGFSAVIFGTTDGGANWTDLRDSANGVNVFTVDLNGVTFSDANNGWAVGDGGTIIATSDGGTNWNPQTIPTGKFNSVAVVPGSTNAVAVGEGGEILKTYDDGSTWSPQDSGGHDQEIDEIEFVDALNGYATSWSGSSFLSTSDGGNTWTKSNPGYVNVFGVSFVTDQLGWIVNYQGKTYFYQIEDIDQIGNADRSPILEITFEPPTFADLIPDRFELFQNFPNPFNPETWIPFDLAENSKVAITIFSSNGETIRILDLGKMNAGSYVTKSRAIHWDGKSELGEIVGSGVYFYGLKTDHFSAIRKMIILK